MLQPIDAPIVISVNALRPVLYSQGYQSVSISGLMRSTSKARSRTFKNPSTGFPAPTRASFTRANTADIVGVEALVPLTGSIEPFQ